MELIYGDAIKVVWQGNAILGEGAIWDDRSDTLYWVDIKGKILHAYTPSNNCNKSIYFPIEICAVAPRAKGGLVAVTRNGFAHIDLENSVLLPIFDPEAHLNENRFNDGNVDTSGNFVAGTMHDLEKEKTGRVYCLDRNGVVTQLFGDYVICNGPAFSPDGRTLYFSNSKEREILAFPYNPDLRIVGAPKLFAKIGQTEGYPDGLTVDAEGCVWCARWDGAGISQYSPEGKILKFIKMPVPRVTRCAFGGPSYEKLYVTSASFGLSNSQLKKFPLSGSLFEINSEVRGMPQKHFLG